MYSVSPIRFGFHIPGLKPRNEGTEAPETPTVEPDAPGRVSPGAPVPDDVPAEKPGRRSEPGKGPEPDTCFR